MSTDRDRALGRVEIEPDGRFTTEDAQALRDGMKHRQRSALALHGLMQQSGQLPSATLLEYRCRRHGCLLLRVFQTPEGPGVFRPAFRRSPEANASSHATARKEHTSDGDRRWVAAGELLDVDPPTGLGVEWWTNCDHLLNAPIPSERINADLSSGTRGKVLIPD